MITIEEIQKAIASKGDHWRAEDTEIFRRGLGTSDDEMLGLHLTDEDEILLAESLEPIEGPPPPSYVDWRDDARAVVTPVKDQGRCGACVAFATNAVLESDAVLRHARTLILSEGHLFHCNGGSCRSGWGATSGLVAAQRNGVGLDSALPWSPTSGCVQIPPALFVTRFSSHVELQDRKAAVSRGPVLAGMDVYEDFSAYSSGVYRHVVGNRRGGHAVCVVGYSDPDSCWFVKNSWGPRFGENGFFRIGYGECEIDGKFAFYSAETRLA
jgi:hypothetical protein